MLIVRIRCFILWPSEFQIGDVKKKILKWNFIRCDFISVYKINHYSSFFPILCIPQILIYIVH
jgi:hypothetical protein